MPHKKSAPTGIEVGIEKNLEELTEVSVKMRDSTFKRFPILFALATTFGLVATLYGFEKVIDRIDLFQTYPELLLLLGIATLAGTGTLYKKLR
jgi:hypothetical protein